MQRSVTFGVGLVVIAGLIAADTVVFRYAFGTDYLGWYLRNGAVAGVIFGLVTLAWGDLNKMTGLVSAHPHDYVASCFFVGVLPLSGASALVLSRGAWLRAKRNELAEAERTVERIEAIGLEPGRSPEERRQVEKVVETFSSTIPAIRSDIEALEQDEAPPVPPPRGLGALDVVGALLFSFAFAALFGGWLLVIAPLQYVVNLVAGAPARQALGSPLRASFRSEPGKIVVARTSKRRPLPSGAIESGFTTNPVSFTAAVATGLLLAVSAFTSL
jgi:hypothetical protein